MALWGHNVRRYIMRLYARWQWSVNCLHCLDRETELRFINGPLREQKKSEVRYTDDTVSSAVFPTAYATAFFLRLDIVHLVGWTFFSWRLTFNYTYLKKKKCVLFCIISNQDISHFQTSNGLPNIFIKKCEKK